MVNVAQGDGRVIADNKNKNGRPKTPVLANKEERSEKMKSSKLSDIGIVTNPIACPAGVSQRLLSLASV
ncbi:MAG: hypothetical protein LUH36_00810 [Oscillospiraceae bacterium]|nr:hypothetical protein [Oscillospiraceae bacterium]